MGLTRGKWSGNQKRVNERTTNYKNIVMEFYNHEFG